MKRIALISDQHGRLPEIPECDILVIAGDVCPVDMPHDPESQRGWLNTSFRAWLNEIPAKHVVGIAGNHDFVFEAKEHPRDLRWTYLIDSGCEIEGFKFWGTPWVPRLTNWAFCSDGTVFEEENTFARIPEGLDFLITHGPPYGRGDKIPARSRFNRNASDIYVGCKQIKHHILRTAPRYVVCGHIHEAHGVYPCGASRVYNVALNDEYYAPKLRAPVVLTVPPRDWRRR